MSKNKKNIQKKAYGGFKNGIPDSTVERRKMGTTSYLRKKKKKKKEETVNPKLMVIVGGQLVELQLTLVFILFA
jgi:hypothetical protein